MDKEVVVHTQWNISYKKECFSVGYNEVDNVEPIMQQEESQKEKDKCCILMHICGI